MHNQQLPLQCSIITTKTGKTPTIEIRRKITDQETLKKIIWCTLHEQPIIILPKFTDKFRSIATLIAQKIIIYDKEKEQYYFKE